MINNLLDGNYINDKLDIFFTEYNSKEKEIYWNKKSQEFINFWKNKIMDDSYKLTKDDTNYIVRIIDSNARGHKPCDDVIAKTIIFQNTWEKAFNDLKNKKDVQSAFNGIMNADFNDDLIGLINKLFIVNKGNGNGLTTEKSVMLNAFLFLKNPNIFLSVLSNDHRDSIIDKFGLDHVLQYNSIGEKIINSNFEILNGFNKKYNINLSPRALSEFLYTPHGIYSISIKELWYKNSSLKYNIKINKNKKASINVTELLLKEIMVKSENEKITHKSSNYNIIEQQEENSRIGKSGEDIVFDIEIKRLIKSGHLDLSKKVKIVSDDYSLGYDIISYNNDGTEKYIEVKSTSNGINHEQFFISANELEKSKKLNNYYIYFVFKVDKRPEVRFLECPDLEDNKYFKLIPQSYLVKYKQDK